MPTKYRYWCRPWGENKDAWVLAADVNSSREFRKGQVRWREKKTVIFNGPFLSTSGPPALHFPLGEATKLNEIQKKEKQREQVKAPSSYRKVFKTALHVSLRHVIRRKCGVADGQGPHRGTGSAGCGVRGRNCPEQSLTLEQRSFEASQEFLWPQGPITA